MFLQRLYLLVIIELEISKESAGHALTRLTSSDGTASIRALIFHSSTGIGEKSKGRERVFNEDQRHMVFAYTTGE